MDIDSDSDTSSWNVELINAICKKQGEGKFISEKKRMNRIQECLDEGADVNSTDHHHNTALHIAVQKGYSKLVEFLVRNGANTYMTNNCGYTPLKLAETLGNEDSLSALKKSFADTRSHLPAAQRPVHSIKIRPLFNERPTTSRDYHLSANDPSPNTSQTLRRKFNIDYEYKKNAKQARSDSYGKAQDSFEEDSQSKDEIGCNIISQRMSSSKEENKFVTSGFQQTLHGYIYQLKLLMLSLKRSLQPNKRPSLAKEMEAAAQFDDFVYQSSGLKQTSDGNIYQLKLLLLFLHRGLKKDYKFRLETRMDVAERFDNLIFQYEDKTDGRTVHRFLQAKLKQDESKKIGAKDLLNKINDNFSLTEYFASYRRIRKHPELRKGELKDCIVWTNIDFDYEGLNRAGIRLLKVMEPDDLLDFETTSKQTARYKLLIDHQSELPEVLRKSSDIHVLAQILAEHVLMKKKITLRTDIFRRYHTALAMEVIDIEKKCFYHNFSAGINLSPRADRLRHFFRAKCINYVKLPKTDSSEELMWTKIWEGELQLSSKFGKLVNTNPMLTDPEKISQEFVKLLEYADNENLVKVHRGNAIIANEIHKLVGHVLVVAENQKIYKFCSQFLKDSHKQAGNIEELKNLLKTLLGSRYNDLDRYRFSIKNFPTYVKEQLHSKVELPDDEVINSKEISEFFDKLVFAVNGPNEADLGSILTAELGAESQFNANLIGESFQVEVVNWFKKTPREKWFTNADGKAFFNWIEDKLNTLVCSGLSLSYLAEIKEYGMEFEDDIQELREYLIPNSKHNTDQSLILNLIAAEETLLTAIRVYQTICKIKKYDKDDSLIFISLSMLLLPEIEDRVVRAFNSLQSHNWLIIECGSANNEDLLRLCDKLRKPMNQNSAKRLILITEDTAIPPYVYLKEFEVKRLEVSFNKLTQASQQKLLAKRIISFQGGMRMSFKQLLENCSFDKVKSNEFTDYESVIDCSTLVKLIRNEEIKVGNDLKDLDKIADFYINRKLFYQVILKTDILKCKLSSEVFAISGIDTVADKIDWPKRTSSRFIHLDKGRESEHFKALCSMKDSSKICNVHWLKYVSEKFIWMKSQGNITSLMEYRDASKYSYMSCDNEESTLDFLTEDEFIDCVQGHEVNIISASIGMGKTTLLTSLTRKIKKKNPGLWVISIDLNSFTPYWERELESQDFNEGDIDRTVDFFVEKLADLTTDSEKKILKVMIKNHGGVALLFDGFDVIHPDYREKVMNLLQTLSKLGVEKLVVFTRPHMTEILEVRFGTFCYTIAPLSMCEQREFLIEFRRMKSGPIDDKAQIEERLINHTQMIMGKLFALPGNVLFTGNPLFVRIAAEICQDERIGSMAGSESYEEFRNSTNNELRLLNETNIFRLNKKFRKVIREVESPHREFKEFSRRLRATMEAHSALHKNLSTTKQAESDMTLIINGESQSIPGSSVIRITAIFFGLLKRGDQDPKPRTFIVEQLLLQPKYKNLRALLNKLLTENSPRTEYQFESEASAYGSWKSSLDECRNEFGATIFHVAAAEGHDEITKYFLKRLGKPDEIWKFLDNAKDNSGQTALYVAASCQHWDTLKLLVELGRASVNCSTWNGRTPLHEAAYCGNVDMVKWLVEKKAFLAPNSDDGRTPLQEAAISGQLEVLKWLIDETGTDVDSRNKNNKTLLEEAASSDQLEVFQYLVAEKGADIRSALEVAVDAGSWNVVKWLLEKMGAVYQSDNSSTVLHMAAANKQWAAVKLLAESGGIDIDAENQHGKTVLGYAIESGHLETIKWLVHYKGIDVHAYKFKNGDTILNLATACGNRNVVEWLVEKGVNVNAKNENDSTALHLAAANKQWETVKLLAESDTVDVVTSNKNGRTVLGYAIESGNLNAIKWLIEKKNIDVNADEFKSGEFKNGETILNYAIKCGDLDVVQWLVEKGANLSARGKNHGSVLHAAAAAEHWNILEWLLDQKGADVAIRELLPSDT